MLPYDVARCDGVMPEQPMLHAACVRCLRRTEPGNPDGTQVYIVPPEFENGKCPMRIGLEGKHNA